MNIDVGRGHGRGGLGGAGSTETRSIQQVVNSTGLTLCSETTEDHEAIGKALGRHGPLLRRLLLDGREGCVVDADQDPDDAQPLGLVLLARQVHSTGKTAEALNLVVHAVLDLPAMPVSPTRRAVECLTILLAACNPTMSVADAGVLRCWLQTLNTFGVIESQQLEGCLAEMNRCDIGFDKADDLGATRATMKVVDGLVCSMAQGAPDRVTADMLLQRSFEFVCGDRGVDARNYLLASLERGSAKARVLAKRLMDVDARRHAMREVDDAQERMRSCGWTSHAARADDGIRYRWKAPRDPGQARSAENALIHYLLATQRCPLSLQFAGLVDAGIAALQRLDTGGRHVELLLALRPNDKAVLAALVERRLESRVPISQAENARLRDRLAIAMFQCKAGDQQMVHRLEAAWHRLAWQPGLLAADLGQQMRGGKASSSTPIAQNFVHAVTKADPMAGYAAQALMTNESFGTAVLRAHDRLPSPMAPPSPEGLQMRRNLLSELLRKESVFIQARHFHLLAGCFPDQDDSVRSYAQVMAPSWRLARSKPGQRNVWLACSQSRAFKLSDQQTMVGSSKVSGDFGFGDVDALREQRFTGIRRLDLLAIGLFRVFFQDGSDWEGASADGLDAEVRMAFALHANERYAALCAAAVFAEIGGCCPAEMEGLRSELQRKAIDELDHWSDMQPASQPPLPIDEADARAWADRLRERLNR